MARRVTGLGRIAVRAARPFRGVPPVEVATKLFFDRNFPIEMDERHKKALNHIGAICRKHMQSLIKDSSPRKGLPHSQPGKPPLAIHPKIFRGSRQLKGDRARGVGVLYIRDTRGTHSSVIIGHAALRGYNPEVKPANRASVPELLDRGGVATARKTQWVVKNHKENYVFSPKSKKARALFRRKSVSSWDRDDPKSKRPKDRRKLGRKKTYHWKRLRPGTRRFEARPFRDQALKMTIKDPRLKQAWGTVRSFKHAGVRLG